MSGLVKAKQYKVEDSNIANLGSDLEREVKKASAETEPAWANAGKKVGLQIWRIEKFNVVSWPKEQYGSFYSGDSYIVLNTYLKDPENNPAALAWDVHFWLGEFTTQDEAGTAAYKTVELDTLLDDAPVQHREVQDHESALFLSYFKDPIRLLDGGIDSGFNHVEPDSYQPRLLHIKGRKKIRVRQVPMTHESLNNGDVFILDKGLHIYQFNGAKAAPGERSKGGQLSRALDDERKGLAEVHVYAEGDSDIREFWTALGDEGPIKSAEEGGADWEAEEMGGEKKLFRLSDASGAMEFSEVGSGSFAKDLLDSSDVFILDNGAEVFAWIGKGASVAEKSKALGFAQDYLTKYNRPAWTPITRIFEGGENEVFEASFD